MSYGPETVRAFGEPGYVRFAKTMSSYWVNKDNRTALDRLMVTTYDAKPMPLDARAVGSCRLVDLDSSYLDSPDCIFDDRRQHSFCRFLIDRDDSRYCKTQWVLNVQVNEFPR
jgi:hypothetical protein